MNQYDDKNQTACSFEEGVLREVTDPKIDDSNSGGVELSEYIKLRGGSVEYNPDTQELSIGNNLLTQDFLTTIGAVLDPNDNRWKISESMAESLLK